MFGHRVDHRHFILYILRGRLSSALDATRHLALRRRTLQHENRSFEWIFEWIKQALVEVVKV